MLSRRFVLLALLAGCGRDSAQTADAPRRVLTVAAAASLKEALLDIEKEFEKGRPGVDVVFTFAGSQTLAAQIVEGAPVDVFAAADHVQIERASARLQPPRVFAKNKLVIVAPIDNAEVSAPADLARPGVKVVLAAEGVPAGAYARQALALLGLGEAALANVVSNEENVRGVVGKVAAAEADAGVVYATDVTAAVASRVRTIAFTGAESIVPTYEVAALKDSAQPELAAAFVETLAGEPGAAALKKHGFLPP